MKNYKEDVVIPGLGRLQGFINTKTANWKNCIEKGCHILPACQKSFQDTQEVHCMYLVEKVLFEYDEQEINEPGFSAIKHNATGNDFVSDIFAHFRGTSTPSLTFNYAVASTLWNEVGEPNESNLIADDANLIGWGAVANSGTGATCISIATFGVGDGNTLSTTISGVPASTTTFDIADATGLIVNDRVAITQTAPLGVVKRKVSVIAGTTITISEALDAIPVSGNAFNQEWSRLYLVTNGVDIPPSGTVASVAPYYYQKSATVSKAIYFTLRLKG